MAIDNLTDTICVYQGCNNRITQSALLTHMHCNKHAQMRCATCCHPLYKHTHGIVCPGDFTASYFFKEDTTGKCGQAKQKPPSTKQQPTTANVTSQPHLPQSTHPVTPVYSPPANLAPAPQTSIGQRLGLLASATVALTQIAFSALLMLAGGAGMVYGGILFGQWMAYEVMWGVVPHLTALSFLYLTPIYLTPILTFALFAIYAMPFIWTHVGNSSRFTWSGRITAFIARVAETTRLAVASLFIFLSGSVIFWGAVRSGNWLASALLNLDFVSYSMVQPVPYITPIIGFIVLALYIAPWLWDRITGRGIPQWTVGARAFTQKIVKLLLVVLLFLSVATVALSFIRD